MVEIMTLIPQRDNIITLPKQELRDIFNAMEIASKGRERFLIRKPAWGGARRPRHLSVGSRSRIWMYFVPTNPPWLLAIAHVYLERGGARIGEPDPKEIRIDELILRPQ